MLNEHNIVFARSGHLSVHKLVTSCIRRCLVSRACDWVMSALSAALLISSFQFSLLFPVFRFAHLKPRPYQQQCPCNIVECYKLNNSFDNVECCFDIVATQPTRNTVINLAYTFPIVFPLKSLRFMLCSCSQIWWACKKIFTGQSSCCTYIYLSIYTTQSLCHGWCHTAATPLVDHGEQRPQSSHDGGVRGGGLTAACAASLRTDVQWWVQAAWWLVHTKTTCNAGVASAWLSPSLDDCSAQFPAWHEQRATLLCRHAVSCWPAARDSSIMWELAYEGPCYGI